MDALQALARRKALEFLGRRTGVPQKMAQFLSSTPRSGDAHQGPAPGSAAVCAPKALTLKEVEALLEERSPATKAALAWISPRAVTASLGQVHEARLRCGRPVALKVQYPGLGKKVSRELSWLLWAARKSPARAAGIDIDAHGASLRALLDQELDYTLEAAHLRTARAFASRARREEGFPLLALPEPLTELSTKDILLMEWLPFESARTAGSWEPSLAARMLEDIFTFTLGAFLSDGRLYADAHLGNIGRAGDRAAAVDFGLFPRVEGTQVGALKGLLLAALETDGRGGVLDVVSSLERAGFDISDAAGWAALGPRLPTLLEALLLPFRGPGLARSDDFRVGAHARAILGPDAWTFRASGPPWFFGVMRLLANLFVAARHVGVPFDARGALARALALEGDVTAWHPTFVSSWGVEASAPKLQGVTLAPHAHSGLAPSRLAQVLRVRLVRDGRDVVSVEMPARAVFRLDDLLSDDVRERIQASGRSVANVQAEILARGLVPGEVLRETTASGLLVLSLE